MASASLRKKFRFRNLALLPSARQYVEAADRSWWRCGHANLRGAPPP
jgi:hypothetical protein